MMRKCREASMSKPYLRKPERSGGGFGVKLLTGLILMALVSWLLPTLSRL